MARVAAIVAVGALFAAVVILRWQEGFSNIDDYLYAEQTRAYRAALPDPAALWDAWRAHGSNTPLVPMLAVPLQAVSASPHWLVLVQVIPLAVLVLSVRSLLGSLGLSARAAWLGAGGIGTLAPVMAYAAMYHFGLAAAAMAALAYAAYARSDRLARLRPALVGGVALGLLALTRVVSPVYVAAVVAPIAVDALWGADRGRLRNAAAAGAAGLAVAAPWWIACGGRAWNYLVSAGYESGTFTYEASRLSIARARLGWTADESGWLLAVVVTALLVYAVVRAVRRVPEWRLIACLAGTCVLGMAMLATSSNSGTAFALPFVVLGACAGVAGLPGLRGHVRTVVTAVVVAAVAIPALALVRIVPEVTVASQPLWQSGIPAWEQAQIAQACDTCDEPDTDTLNDDVREVIGSEPTLVVRIDALVNPPGLAYGGTARAHWPKAPGTIGDRELIDNRFVVAGVTLAPYVPPPDQALLERTLRDARFRPVMERRLSPVNTVVVWGRAG